MHYKLYADERLLAEIYDERVAFDAFHSRIESTCDPEVVRLIPLHFGGVPLIFERKEVVKSTSAYFHTPDGDFKLA